MKSCLVSLALLLLVSSLSAQEDTGLQRSTEVLEFGIDSEVMDLLDRLGDQGEDRLDEALLTRLEESRNRALQGRILELFEDRNVPIAGEPVRQIILENDRLDPGFLRIAVRYLATVADITSPDLLARYEKIARDSDVVAASVAIGAIGSDGSPESTDLLMKLYDEFSGVDLKGAVIRALGDAGAVAAVEMLNAIVADPYEESSLRQYSAESLGKIGDPSSLETLVSALTDDNSLLRAYATAALGAYDTSESTAALDAGLRDSFWRVRVAALQGIATQGVTDSLPAVAYKARRDPEAPVRQEAVRTLAALGSGEAFDVLREIATDVRSPQADRILAVQLLVRDDLESSLDTITQVIEAEWTVENSRLLDAAARSLVEAESPAVAATYARLLSHPNYIIRVYAIRGIGRAGLSEFADDIQRIAEESPSGILHSTAVATLEQLGVPAGVEDVSAEAATTDNPVNSGE